VKWPGVFSYLLYGSWDFPPVPPGYPPSYPTFVADDAPQYPCWADPSAVVSGWTDPNGGWTDPNAASGWVDPNAGWVDPNAGWVDPNADPSSLAGVAPVTPPGGTDEEEAAIRMEIESSRARILRQQALEARYAAPPPWRSAIKVEKPPEPKVDPLVAAVQKSAAVPLGLLNHIFRHLENYDFGNSESYNFRVSENIFWDFCKLWLWEF